MVRVQKVEQAAGRNGGVTTGRAVWWGSGRWQVNTEGVLWGRRGRWAPGTGRRGGGHRGMAPAGQGWYG